LQRKFRHFSGLFILLSLGEGGGRDVLFP